MADPRLAAGGTPPPRSYLFVPGDRPERYDKAWDSAADAVILDLEDAVAPQQKIGARESVLAWLSPERPAWVRINAAETPWHEGDLALFGRPGLAGVLVPKAEELCESVLAQAVRHQVPLIPLIETAAGLERARALARSRGVVRLAFGSIDFQADLGIEGEDDALLFFRSQLVLASRLGGLPAPIDGVTVEIGDEAAVRRDALRARRLGFGAKLCIHPKQIEPVHSVLSPGDDERAWASRVIEAMAASGGAAVLVAGRMDDRPVLLRAQRIAAAPGPGERARR